MDTKKILRKSWQILWQYRALWILAMVLALTAANTIYLGPWRGRQNQPLDIPLDNKIKISEYSTIILPGEGLTIDLTAPQGHRVIFTDGATESDFQFLTDLARQVRLSDLIAVATEILILVVLIGLITLVARYVTETAMIRMVNDTEESRKQLPLRQGIRMGWSVRAARLFLIDLLVALVSVGIVALMLSLIIGPIILVEPLGLVTTLLTAFGAFGLLVLTFFLFVVWGILLSLIMQPVRRACVIDNRGIWASIGTGITLLRHHLKEVGTTWLVWIALRVLWAPVSVLVTFILLPILLFFLLAGIAIGSIPAALATGIASLFVNGVTPWIIGAIAGLPLLILVAGIPMLLVGGWVQIYESNLWTLTYRELSVMEHTVQAAQPGQQFAPLQGVAG